MCRGDYTDPKIRSFYNKLKNNDKLYFYSDEQLQKLNNLMERIFKSVIQKKIDNNEYSEAGSCVIGCGIDVLHREKNNPQKIQNN